MKKIIRYFLCWAFGSLIGLGVIKIYHQEVRRDFEAWQKQTGNPQHLTCDEWVRIRRDIRK
jgi:hypothetical protein